MAQFWKAAVVLLLLMPLFASTAEAAKPKSNLNLVVQNDLVLTDGKEKVIKIKIINKGAKSTQSLLKITTKGGGEVGECGPSKASVADDASFGRSTSCKVDPIKKDKAVTMYVSFRGTEEEDTGKATFRLTNPHSKSRSSSEWMTLTTVLLGAPPRPTTSPELNFEVDQSSIKQGDGGIATVTATNLRNEPMRAELVLSATGASFGTLPDDCTLDGVPICSMTIPAEDHLSLDFPFTATGSTTGNLRANLGWNDDGTPQTLNRIASFVIPGEDDEEEGDEEKDGSELSLFKASLKGPATSIAGERLLYEFDVISLAGAEDYAVDFTLTGPAEFVKSVAECQLDGAIASCSASQLTGGANFGLLAKTTGPGTVTLTPTVSAGDPPDAITTIVAPLEADLEITQLEVTNGSPKVGETLEVKFSVTNHGPTAVRHAAVSTVIPDGIDLGDATSDVCVLVGRTVTCFLGTINPGATLSGSVWLTPQTPGSYSATITAHSKAADPDMSNNARALTVTVGV